MSTERLQVWGDFFNVFSLVIGIAISLLGYFLSLPVDASALLGISAVLIFDRITHIINAKSQRDEQNGNHKQIVDLLRMDREDITALSHDQAFQHIQ